MRSNQANFSHRESNQINNEIKTVRELVISDELVLSDNWEIQIPRWEALSDEPSTLTLDLSAVVLPPNGLFPYPMQLIDRPRLAAAVVLVIDNYLASNEKTKSRSKLILPLYTTITLLIEYLWIQDVIDLKDAARLNFEDFPKKLAKGGWIEVLQIDERLKPKKDQAAIELFKGGYKKSQWIKKAINTNCGSVLIGKERYSLLKKINDRNIDINNANDESAYLSQSTIRICLAQTNYLSKIDEKFGLDFVPYPSTTVIAKKYGRPKQRTKNLDITDCGKLIRTAITWIYQHSDDVLCLVEELVQATLQLRPDIQCRSNRLSNVLNASKHKIKLEDDTGLVIASLDMSRGRNGIKGETVRSIVGVLMTACFITIAFMNGRRKDEVRHKKIGLQVGNLNVVSQELGLYEVDFYVEKTYKERLPFYVNQSTHDAILILEKLEEIFSKLDIQGSSKKSTANPSERPLFSYRRLSNQFGIQKKRKWYDFTIYTHDKDASLFLSLALDKEKIELSSHMFRRAYALMHYYRYENSDLQALSADLGHMDLGTTLIYVTDPASRPQMESIAKKIGKPIEQAKEAYLKRIKDIDDELQAVGEEKLANEIFNLLDGGNAVGGYAKYIKRLFLKFSTNIKFGEMSMESKSESIFQAVKKRGHFPKPMKHGQCMAGNVANKNAAHCFSKKEHRLAREDAKHELCVNCQFHLTGPAYVRNLESDLNALKGRMTVSNLLKKEIHEIENLEQSIVLLKRRILNQSEVQD